MIQKLKGKQDIVFFGISALLILLIIGALFSNNRMEPLATTSNKDEEISFPTKLRDENDGNTDDILSKVDALIEELEEQISNLVPADYEGNSSFFTMDGTIARNTGEGWEFSNDGGKTWSKEAPEGFETSDEGIQYKNRNEKIEIH